MHLLCFALRIDWLFDLRFGLVGLVLPYESPSLPVRAQGREGKRHLYQRRENAYLCVHNTLARTVELRVLGDVLLVGVWVLSCSRLSSFTLHFQQESSYSSCLLDLDVENSVFARENE